MTELPREEAERYTLAHVYEHLVSITTTTIAAKRNEMTRPEEAIWAVPGLRQARLLLDKGGSLEKLRQEATAFSWAPLQKAADEYASYTTMGDAEEVHKILSALSRRDEHAALYGTLGLILGLTRAMAVQRGLMIQSENSYFRQVQEAAGLDSPWTRYHRLAAGFERGPEDFGLVEGRARAGLRLYEETISLLRDVLRPEHVQIITETLALIRRSGY